MLFGFRGIRGLQVILSVVAVAMGVGAVVFLKIFSDERTWYALVLAVIFGAVFLWAFATTLRAPTSFVAVAEERTRIRFAGFVDTVVPNSDILGARLVRHRLVSGIGVRTNFAGDVALVSAWGDVAELTLRRPLRVWLIPRLLPVRATRLRVSVRNPAKLVERFGAPPAAASPAKPVAGTMKRRRTRKR
jgi:hypothetical protein